MNRVLRTWFVFAAAAGTGMLTFIGTRIIHGFLPAQLYATIESAPEIVAGCVLVIAQPAAAGPFERNAARHLLPVLITSTALQNTACVAVLFMARHLAGSGRPDSIRNYACAVAATAVLLFAGRWVALIGAFGLYAVLSELRPLWFDPETTLALPLMANLGVVAISIVALSVTLWQLRQPITILQRYHSNGWDVTDEIT